MKAGHKSRNLLVGGFLMQTGPLDIHFWPYKGIFRSPRYVFDVYFRRTQPIFGRNIRRMPA